jgi:hypothetical protein
VQSRLLPQDDLQFGGERAAVALACLATGKTRIGDQLLTSEDPAQRLVLLLLVGGDQ